MQIKVIATTLLAAITACAAVPGSLEARHDGHKFPCQWYGNGPYCQGYCPWGTYKLTFGKGGGNNGEPCKTGEKFFCCKDKFKAPKCKWYGTAPDCNEECPKDTIKVTSDGDDCKKGCKVFCCEKHKKDDKKPCDDKKPDDKKPDDKKPDDKKDDKH